MHAPSERSVDTWQQGDVLLIESVRIDVLYRRTPLTAPLKKPKKMANNTIPAADPHANMIHINAPDRKTHGMIMFRGPAHGR